MEKEREREKNRIRINDGESEKENKEDRKEVPTSNIASLPQFSTFSLPSPGSLEMRRQAASDPASG